MNQGYIKLYRKSIDSQVFQNPHLWKLWTLCLMKANHKEAWVSVDHIIEPIKILPGQFITGRYSLHKEYYPKATKKQKSALTVWRWLLFLEKVGNLSIKTNNKYSIVTIINWETYQGDKKQNEQVNEQQMNNKRTTDEQQMNTNKNVKNDKKEDIVEKESRPANNIPYEEIIDYLNEKVGTHFKHKTKTTRGFIKARWNEDPDFSNIGAFRYVIDVKCGQWLNDPKMIGNLRPQTLFGTKFESYLNEVLHE